MSKKAKILSIDIELEDFEPIHLKLAEAKELYEQLHELFGKKKDVQYIPWYTQPYWYYTGSPTIITGTGTTTTTNGVLYSATSKETGMTVTCNTTQ